VPGPWSRADLRFQAENVLTTKLHNAGCNCVATQVLVLPSRWELRDAFLDELRRLMQELPPRGDYYPGAAERRRMIVAAHPNAEQIGGPPPRILVTGIDPEAADEVCFTTEAFTAALAETSLPGDDPGEFLSTAVEFCNRRLDGTLGAGLIVHPRTARELGPGLQAAIGALRYGAIGVNVWSGAAFLLAQASWGAYPGHTLADVGSGIGKVHNSFLFDRSEKTVVWSSFYPFPRSWMHGDPSLLPKPPWFVTNRTAAVTTRRVAQFACDPGWRHLPGIFASALRG
jgi:aldehyde dehydrogenase (NAD(P)+)